MQNSYTIKIKNFTTNSHPNISISPTTIPIFPTLFDLSLLKMANTPNNFFPYYSPPPPSPPHVHPPPPPPHVHPSPPPPHVHPPPSIPPPAPSPDDGPTVIVIVFISCGGVFFLAFLAVVLFCFLRKKKKKKNVEETDLIHVDEHKKIKEQIVEGPHGVEAVALSTQDDIHVDEVIKK